MNKSTLYHSLTGHLYRPFGLDQETGIALWIMLGGAAAVSGVILLTGSILAAGAVTAVLILLSLTFYRLDYSLMVLIACVLIFDQYGIPGFDPFTHRLSYFNNLKEIQYLPSFEAGVVNPIELHFLLIFKIWFLILCIRKQFEFRRIPLWGSFGLFFGWLLFAFLFGMRNGGDFLIALWEVRALFYLAVMYTVIPQVIHSKQQIRMLMWIIISTISFKALQGIVRYASLGFNFGGYPTLTNHEDAFFMVTLFILLLGFTFYKADDNQRRVLLFLLLPLILGFLAANRRAAIASLLVSVIVFSFLLGDKIQWRFIKRAVPVFILIIIYGLAGWNIENRLTSPVQLFKSGIERPDREENPRDYYSNLYREFENYNLAHTTRNHPIIGIGFGRQYDRPLELAEISFPLRDYIPHNQIYWVLVKTGGLGFFLFWFFFNAFAFKASVLNKRMEDPYLKAVCSMVIVAIIGQMVVSFYDLQLTYYRNMIYLGTLMGLIPVMENLQRSGDKKQKSNISTGESE